MLFSSAWENSYYELSSERSVKEEGQEVLNYPFTLLHLVAPKEAVLGVLFFFLQCQVLRAGVS